MISSNRISGDCLPKLGVARLRLTGSHHFDFRTEFFSSPQIPRSRFVFDHQMLRREKFAIKGSAPGHITVGLRRPATEQQRD